MEYGSINNISDEKTQVQPISRQESESNRFGETYSFRSGGLASGGSSVGAAKKRGRLKTVVALSMAVIVLGGFSGFGGAYLMNEILGALDNSGGSSSGIAGDTDRSNAPLIPEQEDSISISDLDTLITPKSDDTPYTASELYVAVSDSVVGIKTTQGSSLTDDDTIIGSGVIFSTDGYVITCEHVISGANNVYVVVNDYDDPSITHDYKAVIVGYDSPTDLAVLKIESKEPFKAAAIGNSGDLREGDDVCAIGNPVGLEKSITKGIVSGLQRDLGDDTYELPSIQTDAALNMGNSGCPLFDMYGNVIGIVNKKIVYNAEIDNLGFAISIDEAKPIINELMEHGTVTSRAMLGITAQEITPNNAAYFGIEAVSGLYVESVRQGTPAAESGLSRGDIITKIDGVDVASISDVQGIIKNKKAGDVIETTVIRYDNFGNKETIKIKFALTNGG